jgi:SAM-dependent methyltransferase
VKKLIHYISNFLYFTLNWNPVLAWFIIRYDVRKEKYYGINTFRRETLRRLTLKEGNISHSSAYEAVNYFILENLLGQFRKLYPSETSMVDAGCGKGRVLAVAPYFGFTQITGIDIARELCEMAEKNTGHIKRLFPGTHISILWENITDYHIKPMDRVFFLFNPFDKTILQKFLRNIENSLIANPRPVYILYASPTHSDLFAENKFRVIYRVTKLKYLEGQILIRLPV